MNFKIWTYNLKRKKYLSAKWLLLSRSIKDNRTQQHSVSVVRAENWEYLGTGAESGVGGDLLENCHVAGKCRRRVVLRYFRIALVSGSTRLSRARTKQLAWKILVGYSFDAAFSSIFICNKTQITPSLGLVCSPSLFLNFYFKKKILKNIW